MSVEVNECLKTEACAILKVSMPTLNKYIKEEGWHSEKKGVNAYVSVPSAFIKKRHEELAKEPINSEREFERLQIELEKVKAELETTKNELRSSRDKLVHVKKEERSSEEVLSLLVELKKEVTALKQKEPVNLKPWWKLW